MLKKVLVTGSSGYLGKNFINQFSNNYELLKFSLIKNTLKSLKFSDISTVLHCAGLVHNYKKITKSDYYKINNRYPLNLAKLAKENGVNHFIFISTVAVYDKKLEYINEKSLCNPYSIYGKSKLKTENELLELESRTFNVSIIRIPMIYGIDAPGNIKKLTSFVKFVPFLPFKNLNNKRSIIHINKICSFIDDVIKKKVSGILLLSDDISYTLPEIIKIIEKQEGIKVILFRLPFIKVFFKYTFPDFYKKIFLNLIIENSKTLKRLE